LTFESLCSGPEVSQPNLGQFCDLLETKDEKIRARFFEAEAPQNDAGKGQ